MVPVTKLILTKDTTAPSLVSVTPSGDSMIVKFDEPVKAGTSVLVAGTSTLPVKYIDTDGVLHDYTAAGSQVKIGTVTYGYDVNGDGDITDSGEDQYVVIQLTAPVVSSSALLAGSYTVTLPANAIEDKAATPNVLTTATTLSFTTTGTSANVTLGCSALEILPSTIEFDFTANVTSAALTRTSFTINGSALPVGTNLYFYNNKQTVRADLPVGTITATGYRTLAPVGVVDENGNTLTSTAKNGVLVYMKENVPPVAQSISLVDGQNLNVQMSEAIVVPTSVTGIEVWINGVKIDTSVNALTFDNKSDTTVLHIAAANTNTFAPTQSIVVKFVSGCNITDVNGTTIAVSQVAK